jgi:predicted metalloendopeptidase
MVWHLIKPLVHLLSQPFREAYDAFEMIEKGSQPTPSPTSECVARSEALFGFATGMLYVTERSGKEAKSEVHLYHHHHHTIYYYPASSSSSSSPLPSSP